MKLFLIFVYSFFLPQSTTLEKQLTHLAGTNRVVVLYAPSQENAAYQLQKKWFAEVQNSLKERDLLVIDCVGEQLPTADALYLQRRFQCQANQFGFWLIGKDGGLKLASSQPVKPEQLFAIIDAMPMRRAEMNKN